MNVTSLGGRIAPFSFPPFIMEKSDAIRLRKQVQSLSKRKLSVSEIARRLNVSRLFVRTWKDAKDSTADGRGWVKGRKRKYNDRQEKDVLAARTEAEKEFFSVHTHSHKNSMTTSPSISFIAPSARTVDPNPTARKRRDDRSTCSTRSVSSKQSERR